MDIQFCDRYRERNASRPREMLALRNTKVDLTKWEPISFGRTPPSKVHLLAQQGFAIIEGTAQSAARAARWLDVESRKASTALFGERR
jgi:hypothetical protein